MTLNFRYFPVIIFSISMIFLISISCFAQNPLLSSSKKSVDPSIQSTFMLDGIMKKIIPIQFKLNQKISALTKKIKTDKSYIFVVIFFSFIYGLVHAIGPGHGKFIISSYFLSRKSHYSQAGLSGFIIAFTHGLSAIILISIIFLILKLPILSSLTHTTRIVSMISYALIAGMGIVLLWKAINEIRTSNQPEHSHNKIGTKQLSSYITISFVTGLIPCPGAATLILFSISANLFFWGILAILAMSFGMGLMISLVAVGTLLFKKSAFQLLSNSKDLQFKLTIGLRFAGAIFLFLIGIILFVLAL